MIFRVVIFSVIAALLLAISFMQPATTLGAAALGLALGGIVGVVGLRLTQFELGPQGNFYTPHAYIGGAVSALLVARIIYRFFVVFPTMQSTAEQAAANGNPYAGFQSSPLTLAILMLTAGYYITYYAGILLKVRASRPPTA
jgi:cytochrome b561